MWIHILYPKLHKRKICLNICQNASFPSIGSIGYIIPMVCKFRCRCRLSTIFHVQKQHTQKKEEEKSSCAAVVCRKCFGLPDWFWWYILAPMQRRKMWLTKIIEKKVTTQHKYSILIHIRSNTHRVSVFRNAHIWFIVGVCVCVCVCSEELCGCFPLAARDFPPDDIIYNIDCLGRILITNSDVCHFFYYEHLIQAPIAVVS